MIGIVRWQAGALAVLALITALALPVQAAPKVVVSIAPVHSLVAAVMLDVGAPELLMQPGTSPHAYSLRPSNAQALANADIVFRVDPDMETFLDKPLKALAPGKVITLTDAAGILIQQIAVDDLDGNDQEEPHSGDSHEHTSDPHIWLSIAIARRISEVAAQTLSDHDPDNAGAYGQNLANLLRRLDTLERDLRDLLGPTRNSPYVVLHDAYRHFEVEFGLQRVAAISLSPERRPGARRLRDIRSLLKTAEIKCVFAEPQFPNAIAATVVAGTDAHIAELDPLGAGLAVGPELYFELMKNLGRSLADCLRR